MSSQKHKSRELELARTFRVPRQVTDVTIYQFLSSIDTPRALAVWLMYSNQSHDELSSLEISPDNYPDNPYSFRQDYAATNFLAKASFLSTTFNRKEVALEKFKKFESLCGITNRRFLNPSLDPKKTDTSEWLLNATKRKITQVLGDFDGEEVADDANWGPGVSTLIKGEEVSGYNKFHAERGITRDLYSLIEPWFSTAYPSWHCHLSREFGEKWQVYEAGNSIVTVPKNSKTDRVIAIEPGINLWFQKAIGSMIRRRLARFGIDLNDQSRNQSLAYLSSKNGSLATVDFSSASDSISLEVVRELLPPRWFQLLDCLRSKVGVMADGSVIRWNKFSSMGNGFTFELESLIFFAAASAVQEYLSLTTPISVFGDDVILGTEGYHLFSEFSDFLGFSVNQSKSFSSGDFRESCGSHYFSGVDCKPVFLKERLSNVETIFKLANNVRILAHRFGFNRSCDARFRACWSHLYERVPEPLRFRVPLSAGDTGFISNFDESHPVRARYGIEGYYYRSLVSVGISRRGDGPGLVLAQLRRLGSPSASNLGRVLSMSSSLYVTKEHQPTGRVNCLLRLMDRSFRPDLLESNENYTLRGRSRRAIARPLVVQWYNLGGWD